MKFDLSSIMERGAAMFKQFPLASIVAILISAGFLLLAYLYSITKSDIPISFTMRQTSFVIGRACIDEALGNDALAFVFGPVIVANTSKNDRVILDFTLQVSGSDGTHLTILSGVQDLNGRIFGQRAAESLRKNGLEPPIYLISPIEIDMQKFAQGKLAFIYGPVGEGPITEVLTNLFSHKYEYTLVINDRISATSVELKMPWEYPAH
jgi:hypothetical protein